MRRSLPQPCSAARKPHPGCKQPKNSSDPIAAHAGGSQSHAERRQRGHKKVQVEKQLANSPDLIAERARTARWPCHNPANGNSRVQADSELEQNRDLSLGQSSTLELIPLIG